MDLLVYLTIAVVFLVSFISLAFIHSRFRTGKTFDEVQAEKKLLADKLFGIKPKKVNRKITKKGNNKERKIKERKEQEVDSQNDSDAQSGSVSAGSNNSPSHLGHANKAHVDFSEAEIISDDSVSIKKSLGGKRNTNTNQRKNSGIKFNRTSILINKSETLPIEMSNEATKTLNHFEESHPKGDVEMKRQKEENMPKKDVRKGKYKKDINSSPKIEKPLPSQVVVSNNAALPIIPTVNGMLSVDASTINSFSTIAEMEIDTEQFIQKESIRNVATVNKEKINKKKKNEMISMHSLPIVMNPEDITVNGMISLFGKAELTRSEIQILIDYLLNKQQDTISVNHSDWSDDIVQKLKKQLMDKEKELQASVEQSISIQAKLKEIRATYNEERIQNHQKTITFSDEIGRYKAEITVFQQEIQFLNEKLLNESQLRMQQVQVLQGKLSQAKQANDTTSDNLHKIQQLTDANQTLTNENVSKAQRINELNQFIQEKHQINEDIRQQLDVCNSKLNELEMIQNKNDEQRIYLENEMTKIKQHLNDTEHELTMLHSENNMLHDDIVKLKDEYQTLCDTHECEKNQLKEQLATAEQNKSNHLDDASKVEIRNLQNALDSSKKLMTICNDDLSEQKLQNDILTAKVNEMQAVITSLGVCNNKQSNQIKDLTAEAKNLDVLLSEKSTIITDYEKQLQNQNNKEDELFKQIADHREKNNSKEFEMAMQCSIPQFDFWSFAVTTTLTPIDYNARELKAPMLEML